jgi:hypothetical protein
VARAVKVRTLGGILALALSLTGCASGVDGAGVVGNESTGPGGTAVTVTALGGHLGRKAQFGGPTNLVPNGSFEQGLFPWVGFTGSKLALTTSVHRFGRIALVARPQGKSPTAVGAAIVKLVGRPASGSRYSFSAWIKATPRGSLAGVELAVLKAHSATWTQIGSAGRRVTGRWQHVSARGTVRARNAVYLRATISLNDIPAAGAWLAIDGVEAKVLESGTHPSVGS